MGNQCNRDALNYDQIFFFKSLNPLFNNESENEITQKVKLSISISNINDNEERYCSLILYEDSKKSKSLSPIKTEMKEYDTNYFMSIKEIEINPIKVNFIKKFEGQYFCNVLFEKISEKNDNKPFIANLYIRYNNLRKVYPKLLINYFEQFYRD